ncbi:MAG: methyltransferase [Candidatus Eremiobacterota bacterium]
MLAGELMKDRIPLLRPSPRDREELGFLPARMAELGYTEQGVRDCIGVVDVCLINWSEIPGYHWRCREEGSARADMVTLWLLGQGVPTERLEQHLGKAELALLKRRGLVQEREGKGFAQVDLYPCQGAWVFTDRVLSPVRLPKHVYELGKDSYVLSRVTPRDRVQSALDLCTGSGVHAVNAAAHSDRVVAVDINRRAVDFARVNLAMNGKVGEVLQGDLYQPVAGEAFDLITFNPPFHPTPDEKMAKYRSGGESGEELVEPMVRGLATHLRPGGLLSMVVVYPIKADQTYAERIQGWLGGGDGWGVAHLNFAVLSREFFIQTNMEVKGDWEQHVEEFDRWMNSYQRQGIQSLGVANVFIRRLPQSSPGWSAYKAIPFPNRGAVAPVGPWLKALEAFHDPGWSPDWEGRPQLDPGIRELWVNRAGLGRAEFTDPDWPTPVDLDAEETELATRLGPSLAELATDWAERHGAGEGAGRIAVGCILRRLGLKGLLAT